MLHPCRLVDSARWCDGRVRTTMQVARTPHLPGPVQGCRGALDCGSGSEGRMGDWLPMAEAAKRLGVSADTVKRRIQRGELQAQREARPQGYRWIVELPDDAPPRDAGPAAPQ